jgi:UDP-N-acetylglucosamine 2-epimerase (non-hydrolysing)
MLIDLIVGARPNFIKIAPIIDAIEAAKLEGNNIAYRLVHTGQHYDKKMSGDFLNQLGIPTPNINLEAGGGTQSMQTAAVMIGYEKLLMDIKPDLTLVVGDVTSTMACAISAQKMGVKVAHVEAGIRSGDWTMPEEINRIVTDSISNYFFTTTESASQNLRQCGIADDRIFWVGNTMIDTLIKHRYRFAQPIIWREQNLEVGNYIVVTLHRPSNVDEGSNLKYLLEEIVAQTNGLPVIFPVHPRTAKVLKEICVNSQYLHIVEPMGYLEFNYLVQHAKVVITDSGGITEETTVLGVPCMTLRNTTERPETVDLGTNELLGIDPRAIGPAMEKLFSGNWKKGNIPPLWDGLTSKRIVAALLNEIYHEL